MNPVLQTIKSRRSIRNYLPQQIKEEELQEILDAAIYAPTGRNHQPWHFTVVQNPELVNYMGARTKELMAKSKEDWIKTKGLDKKYSLFHGAPTVIIVSGRQEAYSPLTDCSAAIQNMLLAAESLNLGSCWVGLVSHFFEMNEEVEKLNLPIGYKPYYAVCLGYKDPAVQPVMKERNKDVVNYIR